MGGSREIYWIKLYPRLPLKHSHDLYDEIQLHACTRCSGHLKIGPFTTSKVGYLDDGTTGFPVLENHGLCFGIMLISLQSKQVNKAGVCEEVEVTEDKSN